MPRVPSKTFKKRKSMFSGVPAWKTNKGSGGDTSARPSVSSNVTEPRPTPGPSDDCNRNKQSTSGKKLVSSLDEYEQYISMSNNCSNDIVNLLSFEKLLLDIAVCSQCNGSLSLQTSNRVGLSVTIEIKCNECGFSVSSSNSEKLGNRRSEVNVRAVYAFRCIGKGEQAAKTFCSVMNLPKPPSFKVYNKTLAATAKEICEEEMKQAATEAVVENDGDMNITGIFDGTWQRRGHVSHNGVITAIAANTGKVVDVRVFSRFCRCKNRLNQQHEGNCAANYAGTSGGMEVAGVVDMFRKSEATRGIKYRYYLGDGDCAAFPTIQKEAPYGPEYVTEKLECIAHVRKRMGTRLRTLKTKIGKKDLSDGKKIGGRGRLTNSVIDEIQTYYGLAIMRNTDSLQKMKAAVWATYFHLVSSNAEPAHALCPNGPDTWCKFKKAIAEKKPYNHKDHTHLPPIVMDEIKPIFRDLSQEHLLRKCLHGGTQNPSESLNSVIWSRVPKAVFVMKNTLELGVCEAIATYNRGNIIKCKILHKLGINPGSNCIHVMKELDEVRIKKSEKAMQEIEKRCRKQLSIANKRLEDVYEDMEDPDNPSYGAGMH